MVKPNKLDKILMLAAPFIYNSLWANIETPVFIITGCFLNFGPLYKADYGPRTFLRSLWSRLSRSSAKSVSASPARTDSTSGTMKHTWEVLHEPPQDKSATSRAQWELNNVSSVDDAEPPRRSSTAMV